MAADVAAVNRDFPDEPILHALASTFGIADEWVLMVALTDPDREPEMIPESARMAVDRWEQPGNVPLHLMIIIRDDDLSSQVATRDATADHLRAFCRYLGCDGIASDEELADSTWLLIDRTGEVVPVIVDLDALEEGASRASSRQRHALASG